MMLPSPLGLPIEELGVPLDGLQCREGECSFITVNIDAMRMHRKKKHKLLWRGDRHALYQKVKVQTFFRTGGLQRYFVVNAEDSSSSRRLSVPCRVEDAVSRELAEFRTIQQEEEQRLQVMDTAVAKTDQTGWSTWQVAILRILHIRPGCPIEAK
jgi:hypothetical protein